MFQHTTRIAPSPTGLFHLGSARTALFNWLAAKATDGRFILRIDDTDTARHVPEAVDVIDQAMGWLGLPPDIRFCQSDRLSRYREMADELLTSGAAYKDGEAARLRLPADLPETWEDTIAGTMHITDTFRDQIDGLVIMRSDGYPTYHFASVVDDKDFGVTWVIRGVDHISNTPKHIAIACALNKLPGAPPFAPLWTHIGLITQDRKKLSKRDGAASVLAYRDEGVDPDAMCDWMLRMGWGPTRDDRSVSTITRDRAIGLFLAGGAMRASPAGLDRAKLASFDRKYKAMKSKCQEKRNVA